MKSARRDLALLVLAAMAALLLSPREGAGQTANGRPADAYARSPELARLRELSRSARLGELAAAADSVLPSIEDRFGPESYETAMVLDYLSDGLARTGHGKESKARAAIDRAIRIKEGLFGADHPRVAYSIRQRGIMRLISGELEPGIADVERALRIQQAALDSTDLDLAATYETLGIARMRQGRINLGREAFERSFAIYQATLPEDDPKLGSAAQNLANLYLELGEDAAAEKMFQRAVAILEPALGPDHPRLAPLFQSFGALRRDQGRFAEARSLLFRAVALREAADPEDPDLARQLLPYAGLLRDMGDTTAARAALERAIDVARRAYGPDHFSVAQAESALSGLLLEEGATGKARRLASHALEVQRQNQGPEGKGTIPSLRNLGDIARAEGHLAEAESLLGLSAAIGEKTFGEKHLEVARSLEDLARVQRDRGEAADAEISAARALAAYQAHFDRHPDLARCLILLAGIHEAAGQTAAAFAEAQRGESMARRHFEETIGALSERETLRFASVRAAGLDLLVRLCMRSRSSQEISSAWDAVIRARAPVLEEVMERRRALAGAVTPEIKALLESLEEARTRLANLYVRGSEDDPSLARRIEDTARQCEERESALARESAAFRDRRRRASLGYAGVAAALAPGEALVAYCRYRDGGVEQYGAFVQSAPNRPPRVFSLGEAAAVDERVRRWRESVAREGSPSGPLAAQAQRSYRKAGAALRKMVWDPFAGPLSGSERVNLIPDGALNLVAFGTLPVGDAQYEVEAGPLLALRTTERSLARRSTPNDRSSSDVESGLLSLGDPDFEGDPSVEYASAAVEETGPAAPATSPAPPPIERQPPAPRGDLAWTGSGGVQATEIQSPPLFRGSSPDCAAFRERVFHPLGAAAEECRAVLHAWRSSFPEAGPRGKTDGTDEPAADGLLLLGASASEAAFKRLAPRYRVLHLATHAYLLEAGCASAAGIENPLLLSGLALAGANHRDRASEEGEDGILTAEEVSAMDLSGLELVILSACETGGGAVIDGEGVFGLRRAFEAAGAASLVMSLWPVQDRPTRDWVVAFLSSWLNKRDHDCQAAAREASRAMLAARRAAGQSTHPATWGAFIAVDGR